jgi:phosphoglycerate dehydrogenase-like enzyme
MKKMVITLIGHTACSILERLEEKLHESLEGFDYSIVSLPGSAGMDSAASEWDVIIGGPISSEIAKAAANLKLFIGFGEESSGRGLKQLHRQVRVVHTSHHAAGTAEFVVMSMLMLPRKVYVHDYNLRRGRWDSSEKLWGGPPGFGTLVDKTVVIAGGGSAGPEIGKRLEGFGAHRIGMVKDLSKQVEGIDYLIDFEELPEYLPVADFVIAASPLIPGAYPLFTKREFDFMKPSAYFINVADARVADEMALYYALRDNSIAGAALDCWYRLPKGRDEICYPSDYPFHTLTNVIMSPCRAGWTKELLEKRADEVADAIKRLYTKEPVANH